MKQRTFCELSYTRLSAALLLITAISKLVSATGTAHVLEYPDPLLGLEHRQELWLIAAVELAVVGLLLSHATNAFKYLGAAWLGGSFLIYRLALSILRPGARCKCLGTMTERLHLDDRTAGWILTVIAVFLFAGGLWLFLRDHPAVPSAALGRSAASDSD